MLGQSLLCTRVKTNHELQFGAFLNCHCIRCRADEKKDLFLVLPNAQTWNAYGDFPHLLLCRTSLTPPLVPQCNERYANSLPTHSLPRSYS